MKLEKAVVDTVEGGKMTKDLAILVTGSKKPTKE
jgi:isocitrate dehydrogenase